MDLNNQVFFWLLKCFEICEGNPSIWFVGWFVVENQKTTNGIKTNILLIHLKQTHTQHLYLTSKRSILTGKKQKPIRLYVNYMKYEASNDLTLTKWHSHFERVKIFHSTEHKAREIPRHSWSKNPQRSSRWCCHAWKVPASLFFGASNDIFQKKVVLTTSLHMTTIGEFHENKTTHNLEPYWAIQNIHRSPRGIISMFCKLPPVTPSSRKT